MSGSARYSPVKEISAARRATGKRENSAKVKAPLLASFSITDHRVVALGPSTVISALLWVYGLFLGANLSQRSQYLLCRERR